MWDSPSPQGNLSTGPRLRNPRQIQNSIQAGVSPDKLPLGSDSLCLRTSVVISRWLSDWSRICSQLCLTPESVLFIFYFLFYWPLHTACGILVPRSGMEALLPALKRVESSPLESVLFKPLCYMPRPVKTGTFYLWFSVCPDGGLWGVLLKGSLPPNPSPNLQHWNRYSWNQDCWEKYQ